jgi:hypothetical protein
MAFTVRSLLSLAQRIVRVVESSSGPARTKERRPAGTAPRRAPSRPAGKDRQDISLAYAPSKDGRPDPGEIVWTWVAYEEDPSRGKDRPVLLIARQGESLLGLMLTSRDHTNTLERDSRYVDIGTGGWDRQGRPSEVRVDRLITVDPSSVRREGAVLPRDRFEQVVAALPSGLLDRYRR